jgi:hypothetical protein
MDSILRTCADYQIRDGEIRCLSKKIDCKKLSNSMTTVTRGT